MPGLWLAVTDRLRSMARLRMPVFGTSMPSGADDGLFRKRRLCAGRGATIQLVPWATPTRAAGSGWRSLNRRDSSAFRWAGFDRLGGLR